MKSKLVVGVLVGSVAIVLSVCAQDGAPQGAAQDPALEQRIQRLIVQLGDADWTNRMLATDELKRIGKAALPRLQEALSSDNAEVRARAEFLIKTINPPKQPEAAPAPPEEADIGAVVGRLGALRLHGAGGIINLGMQLRQVFGQVAAALQGDLQIMPGLPPAPPLVPDPDSAATADMLTSFGARLGEAADGLRVLEVKPGTPAARAGLMIGDIVSKVNERQIDKLDDAKAVFAELEPDKPVELEVTRKGETITLTVPGP